MSQYRVTRLMAVTLILAAVLVAGPILAKKQADGNYAVKVAGDYTGDGTADVTTASIKVSAQVQDPGGKAVTFSFDLPMNNGRFFGQGSVGEMSCRVSGRVDGGDPVTSGGGKGKGKGGSNKEVLKNARIGVVFITTDRHVGRVVGGH
jgi:hypothetical protein